MEIGGVVYEDPEYLENLSNEDGAKSVNKSTELVTIPAGLWPMRPTDPNARVIAIDEEQGIVVASAVIDGFVCPYVVPGETASCFVPGCMIEMHRNTVDLEKLKGKQVISEISRQRSYHGNSQIPFREDPGHAPLHQPTGSWRQNALELSTI